MKGILKVICFMARALISADWEPIIGATGLMASDTEKASTMTHPDSSTPAIEYPNGFIYEGEWHEDKRSGRGKSLHASGTSYEGDFVESKQHGIGTCFFSNGSVYKGEWQNGKMNGKGEYTNSLGNLFEGNFIDGKFQR